MHGPVQAYLAEARRLLAKAAETDRPLPLWLPYLPLILVVFAAVSAALSEYTSSSLPEALAVAALLASRPSGAYVVYAWLSRRNAHFQRARRLHEALVAVLEALGRRDPELVLMKNIVSEMRVMEGKRRAVLLALLSLLLPLIVLLYVLHTLNKDFRRHEVRERLYYANLSEMLRKMNKPQIMFEEAVPDRSTLLYLIATLLSLGLFLLYWVYAATRDVNMHLKAHRRAEQRLALLLDQLAEATQPQS